MAPNLRYPVILFDLDGTLLDTLEDIAQSMNRALEQAGFPVHPTDAYRYFVGEGVNVLTSMALPEDRRDEDVVASVMAAFRQDYVRSWDRNTRPYPGVMEMLEELRSLGAVSAILSNKPHIFTLKCVEAFFPGFPFAAVRGQVAGTARKPDPAGALAIAREQGMAPASFAFLGDSATDMMTAVGAGMFPMGALWGFRTREELLEAGARVLVQHPGNLIPLLRAR
ncbi:MAG: HAD family hydrolase [Pseudomonadota bacterium]